MTDAIDDLGPGDERCVCGRDTRQVVVEVCVNCGELVDDCQCEELEEDEE